MSDEDKKHTVIIGFDNVPEIITGLNILAAVTACKKSDPAIEEIYQRSTKYTCMSRGDFADLIAAALEHIVEINKTLEEAGF